MESGTAADLVRRAREGDRAAWAGLVERYVDMVHAVCRCYRLGDGDAAAVNQVVWLRLAESLSRLRAPEAVGGWIAAVARAECLRALRAAGRIVHPGDEIAPAGPSSSCGSHPPGPATPGAAGGAGASGAGTAGTGVDAGAVPANGAVGGADAAAEVDDRAGAAEADAAADDAGAAGETDGEAGGDAARRALLAAYAGLDGPSQRLLRLLASDPRPAPDEIGAALDLPVAGVGPARDRSLGHLRAAVVAGAPR